MLSKEEFHQFLAKLYTLKYDDDIQLIGKELEPSLPLVMCTTTSTAAFYGHLPAFRACVMVKREAGQKADPPPKPTGKVGGPAPPESAPPAAKPPTARVGGAQAGLEPAKAGPGASKNCNCKRSKCLKLYCECFAANLLCSAGCKCKDCENTAQHTEARRKAVQQKLSRNRTAFRPKFKATVGSNGKSGLSHSRGCNCQRSSCRKKYCECFQAGVACSAACRCVDCANDGTLPHMRDYGVLDWTIPVSREATCSQIGKEQVIMILPTAANQQQRKRRANRKPNQAGGRNAAVPVASPSSGLWEGSTHPWANCTQTGWGPGIRTSAESDTTVGSELYDTSSPGSSPGDSPPGQQQLSLGETPTSKRRKPTKRGQANPAAAVSSWFGQQQQVENLGSWFQQQPVEYHQYQSVDANRLSDEWGKLNDFQRERLEQAMALRFSGDEPIPDQTQISDEFVTELLRSSDVVEELLTDDLLRISGKSGQADELRGSAEMLEDFLLRCSGGSNEVREVQLAG